MPNNPEKKPYIEIGKAYLFPVVKSGTPNVSNPSLPTKKWRDPEAGSGPKTYYVLATNESGSKYLSNKEDDPYLVPITLWQGQKDYNFWDQINGVSNPNGEIQPPIRPLAEYEKLIFRPGMANVVVIRDTRYPVENSGSAGSSGDGFGEEDRVLLKKIAAVVGVG